MYKDKLVEEIWKTREKILEDANYEMKVIIEEIKKIESTHKDKLILKPFKKVIFED